MKRRLFVWTAVSALIFVGAAPSVYGQVRSRRNPVQTLEYSLKSLYDSAAEVAKKNKWLREEIRKMDQQITFLTEELRSLDSAQTKKKIGTALQDEELMRDLPWEEERLNMLYEDYIEVYE